MGRRGTRTLTAAVRVGLLVLGVLAASAASAAFAGRALADTAGEFSGPSPYAPPAASVYNTTPTSCPVTTTDPFCFLTGTDPSLPPPDTGNFERYLNSAYWPAEKRPDIEVYGIQQYGYQYENCFDPSVWPHYCFLVDAEAAGYPVSHTPAVGDLVVARCDAFTYPGGFSSDCGAPLGNIYYVGYVEQVFPDGSFVETEGGSSDATDSGMGFYLNAASTDANADFVGFLSPGQSPQLPPGTVQVVVAGGGSGTISDGSGQTCNLAGTATQCAFTEPQNEPITLTAVAQPGSTFLGWQGQCDSASATCAVTAHNSSLTGVGQYTEVYADFSSFVATGTGTGGSGGGSTTTGGSGHKTSAGSGASKTADIPGIARVTTARGMIRASLRGSRLTCTLARRSGTHWGAPRSQACSATVTYRKLSAGRYRLTVSSGTGSVTRIVTVRRSAATPTTRGHTTKIWRHLRRPLS